MSQIILGLDPGTAATGYGIVVADDVVTRYVAHGCITTSADVEMHQRLNSIAKELKDVIRRYKPDVVAIEDIYFYKNVSTAMTVAQARGVLLQTVASAKLPVRHYTPLQVKQALTGHGRADKKQIQKMIKMVLGMDEMPRPDDAADALAVAITCAHSSKLEAKLK